MVDQAALLCTLEGVSSFHQRLTRQNVLVGNMDAAFAALPIAAESLDRLVTPHQPFHMFHPDYT
jgi:hypothetical protein